jgi:thiazole synthase ThiGH ThiG subunit
LHDSRDAAAAAGWGYGAILVGTALMRAGDPTGLISEMLAAGRERRAA